jgi:hypothetical protein
MRIKTALRRPLPIPDCPDPPVRAVELISERYRGRLCVKRTYRWGDGREVSYSKSVPLDDAITMSADELFAMLS